MSKHKHRSPAVTKATGTVQPFSRNKLMRSLERAGADRQLARRIVQHLQERISPGITTDEIYRIAHRELHRQARPAAVRYSLRRAIMELGPSGYPFERFVAALLESQGYATEVDVVLPGACVTHEVDVVARKDHDSVFVECKFHNQVGTRTDVKTTLYVYARSLDLKNGSAAGPDRFWLVTNTKFTSDAIRYGGCVGLTLLGWDYPEGRALQDRVEAAGLLPITCLSTLKKAHRRELLEQDIVLCRELAEHPERLDDTSLSAVQARRVRAEVRRLLAP